jgi:hypothetical protein
MRIASIDYGVSVGLAIADIVDYDKTSQTPVWLDHYLLATIVSDTEAVITAVKAARCIGVVLEAKASNGNDKATRSFDELLAGLEKLGFEQGRIILEDKYALLTISPGVWKPVMKYRSTVDYLVWDWQTQHEKDAMAMLYFAIRNQTPKQKVFFR